MAVVIYMTKIQTLTFIHLCDQIMEIKSLLAINIFKEVILPICRAATEDYANYSLD